jgi:hypothetical protein
MTDFIKENLLCDILVGLGLILVIIFYVVMPIVSKKTGHHSSAVPFLPGILIAAGFLLSPIKWLAVFALVDISIPLFFIRFIPDMIMNKKDSYNRDIPAFIEGCKVVAYTSYYNRYYDIKIPLEDDPEAFKVCPVERLAIIQTETGFELLGLDYQFNIVKREQFNSVNECKSHAAPKAQNRWIDVNR